MATQQPLITPAELTRYGASTDFLAQFAVRAVKLTITTGGVLGTMQFTWQFPGDTNISAPIQSEAGAPWPHELPDPSWCNLTFSDGSYTQDAVYMVSRTGVVTGPDALIAASRFDLRSDFCDEVTSDAVKWMQPRVVAPVITPGTGVKGDIGRIVVYRLKCRVGLTPMGGGAGDDNLRVMAEDAQRDLERIGENGPRPPDLIDSSASNTGAGLSSFPVSDPPRGW